MSGHKKPLNVPSRSGLVIALSNFSGPMVEPAVDAASSRAKTLRDNFCCDPDHDATLQSKPTPAA
jgi:hypothetical protein